MGSEERITRTPPKWLSWKNILIITICLVALILLANQAVGENVSNVSVADTVSNTAGDISSTAKSWFQTIKETVPYEFWFFGFFAMLVFVMFAKGGNFAYASVWRVGLYVAVIMAVIWFLATR